jgi:predicted nuclease of predicted toxin-antitoxin system
MEVGLDRADDGEILATARLQNRTCVTLDRDFHAHLAMAGEGRPSVILLRIEGLGAAEQADLIGWIGLPCDAVLTEEAAVTADGRSLRVRRLPLR